MSNFRIRPVVDNYGYPAFLLEEKVAGFFRGDTWKGREKTYTFHVGFRQTYDEWVSESIEELRKKHRKILDERGINFSHLKHPIIYLDDAPDGTVAA